MVSSYLLRLRPTQLRRPYTGRRTFVTESLRNLTNAFFDLSIALPYPIEWPAYTTTIIVLGIASRVSLLPLSIWVLFRNLFSRRLADPIHIRQGAVKAEWKTRSFRI